MTTQQIKNRYTDEVIYECEAKNIKEAVEKAVKDGVNLSEADLYRANLSEADLYGADLSEADLYGADLYGANLTGANLTGANLTGADLNAVFFKTKVTKEQKEQIVNSDLFNVADEELKTK